MPEAFPAICSLAQRCKQTCGTQHQVHRIQGRTHQEIRRTQGLHTPTTCAMSPHFVADKLKNVPS